MALNLDSIGSPIGPMVKDYTWKDAALYALGVGAGFDDLDYVYEKQLKVIPSFSIGAVFDFLMAVATDSEADLRGILHGEQDILFHAPIPPEGRLTTRGSITHMYDKGADKGALVIAEASTFHDSGAKLFTNFFTLFCRKDGGFGGENAPGERTEFPGRDPDFVQEDTPSRDQPLLYRLSGDVFALHVDPEFAQASGFDKPIMHGLCTHGYACRAVIKHLMPGEPERMTRFRTRFSKTLYPGVPVKTLIWTDGEGRALFKVVNQENDEVVIDNGVVEWMTPEQQQRRKSLGDIHADGKVAVVTGAGAGLGRAYALELARRGAKVVVNDLGGARDGSGDGASKAADDVVAEITKAGGEAVANYDSVATPEGGEAIVNTAIDAFGRVDIVINNAGILRDRSLLKMSDEDWQQVLAVHLDGAYNVTRPALKHMRGQGYGRIVLTTSAAGLHGNFGQTNYSAAKLALVGFMNTLKLEGSKYDIKVNTVAPIATTRLTDDILPPDMKDKLQPELVVPLVLYLAAEQCPDTGGIYNAGMGFFSKAAIVTGPGATVGDGQTPPTAEELAAKIQSIRSLKGAQEHGDLNAALLPILDAFNPDAGAADAESGTSVATVFEQMAGTFQADAAKGVDVVFQFDISGDGGGTWHAVIKDQTCEVAEGAHEKPTTTIKMGDADFVALMEGRQNAMRAYTSGKLKIGGDLMKSQLIEKLFKF
jgi:NAD(P)-dependent dehydrogenase (short-subunit alcohol dehydrogenase family)/acyl dehydratase/putative sterol carrier protein